MLMTIIIDNAKSVIFLKWRFVIIRLHEGQKDANCISVTIILLETTDKGANLTMHAPKFILMNFLSFVKTLMTVSLVNQSTNATPRWEDVSDSLHEDTTASVTLATKMTDNINARVCIIPNSSTNTLNRPHKNKTS